MSRYVSAARVPPKAKASSESRTCRAPRSGSAYTATDESPASEHARAMRTAISPRFAIRTFENAGTAHRNVPRPSGSARRRAARATLGNPPRAGPPSCRYRTRDGGWRAVEDPKVVEASQHRPSCRVSGPRGEPVSPQVHDREADLGEEVAQQREAEADDAVRVSLHTADERAAEPVDRETAGDGERFAGPDVGLDLGIRQVREVHDRRRGGAERRAGSALDRLAAVHDPVARVQSPAAPTHHLPTGGGLRRVGRLSERLAVVLEHRVATEHDGSARCRVLAGRPRWVLVRDRFGLGARQDEDRGVRAESAEALLGPDAAVLV